MHESMEITDRLYGRLANVKDIVTNLSEEASIDVEEQLFRQFEAFVKWRNDETE